jgi:hypothetical protein
MESQFEGERTCEQVVERLGGDNADVLFTVQSTEDDDGRKYYFILAETFASPPPPIIGIPRGWQVYPWYKVEYGVWNCDIENYELNYGDD